MDYISDEKYLEMFSEENLNIFADAFINLNGFFKSENNFPLELTKYINGGCTKMVSNTYYGASKVNKDFARIPAECRKNITIVFLKRLFKLEESSSKEPKSLFYLENINFNFLNILKNKIKIFKDFDYEQEDQDDGSYLTSVDGIEDRSDFFKYANYEFYDPHDLIYKEIYNLYNEKINSKEDLKEYLMFYLCNNTFYFNSNKFCKDNFSFNNHHESDYIDIFNILINILKSKNIKFNFLKELLTLIYNDSYHCKYGNGKYLFYFLKLIDLSVSLIRLSPLFKNDCKKAIEEYILKADLYRSDNMKEFIAYPVIKNNNDRKHYISNRGRYTSFWDYYEKFSDEIKFTIIQAIIKSLNEGSASLSRSSLSFLININRRTLTYNNLPIIFLNKGQKEFYEQLILNANDLKTCLRKTVFNKSLTMEGGII